MRNQACLVVVIAVVLFVRPSLGAGISVNFGDGHADGFFPVEGVAGFVPLENWNNIVPFALPWVGHGAIALRTCQPFRPKRLNKSE